LSITFCYFKGSINKNLKCESFSEFKASVVKEKPVEEENDYFKKFEKLYNKEIEEFCGPDSNISEATETSSILIKKKILMHQ